MVRRQAASNLAKFVKEMPAAIVIDEMIPLFQHLVQDDQDSVRLLTVEILIGIAEGVPKEQQAGHGVLLTSLRNLIEDKSWRVRYMIADRFEKVSGAPFDQNHSNVCPFTNLFSLSSLDRQGSRRGSSQQRLGACIRQASQGQRGGGADSHCWPDSRVLQPHRPTDSSQRHHGKRRGPCLGHVAARARCIGNSNQWPGPHIGQAGVCDDDGDEW